MQVKTIGFEGVSCVGKTTLLERLNDYFEIVPEFTEVPKHLKGVEKHKYFLEKNHASLMPEGFDSDKDILCFDRTIISTIVYTSVLDKLNNTNYFTQLVEEFSELLVYPKYYPQLIILLNIDQVNTPTRIENKFNNLGSDWNNSQFLNLFDRSINYFIKNILPSEYVIVETSGKDINQLFEECRSLIDTFEPKQNAFELVSPELLLTLEEII